MPDRAFLKQLDGYGLTTAEISYHLPDQPSLLQLYIWQEYDIAPRFPELKEFLDFWTREIEGPLHSVRIAHRKLIHPVEFTPVKGIATLH